jgi:hypothetical protein
MRRNSWWFTVMFAVLSGALPHRANAQQIKPYFLVIVDTSGSMAQCAGTQQASNGQTSVLDCSCYAGGKVNNACSGAFNTNRCGLPSNKIGDAKCSLQRIIDGVGGDAVFGLMQFQLPCNLTASPGCTNSQNCANSTCKDGQLDVEISEGNASLMREWVDGVDQGTCDANHNAVHELTPGQWTPLAQSLTRANQYLRGTAASDFVWSTGETSVPASPIPVSDPTLACRPISVILLTDGVDTCAGSPTNDPPAQAALLNAGDVKATTRAGKAFHTYVIGFGAAQGLDPTTLSNIASMGGTDSHDSSGAKYFPAMNEQQLSVALNQIVADSQPPIEICNNQDDDCDTKIDEGLPKYCNKPMGILDATLCDEPPETVCDGQDDDCDGVIDEGLTNACGTCGDVPQEVCDGVDNDCDSRIDEGTDTLASCGINKGECKPGMLVCTNGKEDCQGQIGPSPEICDCKDNDCDGNVDEEGSGPDDKLCPMGQRCAASCMCLQFCSMPDEFEARCPIGLTPEFQANGECLCIVDTCDHMACPKSTIKNDSGDTLCAPNDSGLSACQCKAGACVTACAGVTCASGQTCNPKDGRCVEDDCNGLGCPSGELCDPLSVRCVKDDCASTKCDPDQVCRAGKCEQSCAQVTCNGKQSCAGGTCQSDLCQGVTCDSDQACDSTSGQCGADPCAGVACGRNQLCSPDTGKCAADPCFNLNCPSGQYCSKGECKLASTSPTGGTSSGGAGSSTGNRLLATGGGGCACNVRGGGSSDDVSAGLLSCLFMLGVALRRRVRRVRKLGLLGGLSLLALFALSGCKVSPLCIDCVDASANAPPLFGPDANPGTLTDGGEPIGHDAGSAAGSGGSGNDAGPDSGTDGGVPKCIATGPETCNNKDDDCDFKVDEDVKPDSNDCLQSGVCQGAVPVCAGGAFVCRYANNYETTETLCDGLDNDCDGQIDEPFADLNKACDLGVGACKVTGKLQCNAAHTGLICQVTSTIDPGTEICNGLDDDCDGMIDEPKSTPGSNPSYVKDDVVKVKDGLWMYTYEASRADATGTAPGLVTTRTCSRANVLPWTNVTYTEAQAACQSVGLTICNLSDWLYACGGGTSCGWGESACNTYTNQCNGHDESAQPGDTDSDALAATGSHASCYADFGSAGRVFDLSGNAKEWTTGDMSPTQNPLRGGSYNNNAMGLRCDFDFTLAEADVRLQNVGFRCCSSTEP